MNGWYCH
ncbi:hypothetical protein YPPY36_1225, partial [Yersinia pestis PY-36]